MESEMSEDVMEIHRMIQRAVIGDGDEVLNILEKVVEKLADLERQIKDIRYERPIQ